MPEVKEVSGAQPPVTVTSDPITAVGVVASKSGAPADFYVVAQTTDGGDADLWKDGLFKSKVKRFLCFSRASPQHVHEERVLVDLKLVDLKDVLPADFYPIQETMDTSKPNHSLDPTLPLLGCGPVL
ncbi:multivesicular body subunit 12B-like [Sardina pilchardus]|uniref:multivesicular body subunit 12B-like n=1 Tax=Sardina pilchardus TaxID=27697 RepID=UPI002E13F3BE